ncbi:MAG: insulinase family protein [bacterium]|nr:insulinase family protein [bacterium]
MTKFEYSDINETLYYEKLDNGLSVYIVPKSDYDKTFGIFTTEYGGLDNRFIPYGKNEFVEYPKGIAHFLEHKLFEMEDGIDASTYLLKYGASSNAFTSFDRTSYLFSTTSHVKECTMYLLDFVQSPYFTKENIKKECGIIEQEIKMYLDEPESRLFWGTLKNLYKNNYVSTDLVGTVESINKITKEMLYSCYETFYHPSNMNLFIIGNVDLSLIDDIKENQSKKNFKEIKEIKREYATDDFCDYIKESSIKMDVLIPKVSLGLRFKKIYENFQMQDIKMSILTAILFGESSSLRMDLMEKGLINDTFSNYSDFNKSASYLMIQGDSAKPDELFNILKKFILDIPNKAITDEEFECAKRALIGQFIYILNSLESTAQNFSSCLFSGNNLYTIINDIKNMKKTDLDEIKNMFKEVIITKFEIFPDTI